MDTFSRSTKFHRKPSIFIRNVESMNLYMLESVCLHFVFEPIGSSRRRRHHHIVWEFDWLFSCSTIAIDSHTNSVQMREQRIESNGNQAHFTRNRDQIKLFRICAFYDWQLRQKRILNLLISLECGKPFEHVHNLHHNKTGLDFCLFTSGIRNEMGRLFLEQLLRNSSSLVNWHKKINRIKHSVTIAAVPAYWNNMKKDLCTEWSLAQLLSFCFRVPFFCLL